MAACRELVQAALPDWSTREIDNLIQSVDRRTAAEIKRNPGLSFNEAVERARAALAEEVETAAQGARLQAAKNAAAVLQGLGRVRNANDPVEGLRSLLIGTQRAEAGARLSAAAEQRALQASYVGGLTADVARTDGGLDLLASGAVDQDIARALWRLDQPESKFDGLDPRAVEIAKAVRKWQEVSRLDANAAGANIGKLDDYITRQSHDASRIAADRAGWEAMMRRLVDWDRMEVAEADIPNALDRLWTDLKDGIHLKAGQERPGRAIPKGAGRKLSKERSIHFRDADGWLEYNAAYGLGNVREAVMQGLESSARATGLMRVLGPDHEMNLQRIVDNTLRSMKASGKGDTRKFQDAANRYRSWYLAELDGSTVIPGSAPLASFGSGVRALQNMSALGSSVFASVSDLATIALGARYQGASIFDSLGAAIGGLFRGAKTADRLELMADLGMAFDSIAGKITSGGRFSIDDNVAGTIGKLQHQFFSWNLQHRWTDSLRAGAAEFLSMNLARKAGKAWIGVDALPESLRTTLGLYGIDAGRWDLIRTTALREFEGRQFLTPEAITAADGAPFAAYLGDKATPATIRELKRDLQRSLRAYFSDQNGYMVLTPDAATSGALKMGTQRGTPEGEALRMIMQFKSFAYAFTQRIAGRELQQLGWHGVARTLLATSMFGFIAMTLKDLAKGKKLRDPTDPRTIIAALQQGGGAGLYSDLLFSQIVERRFGDAGLQLFGPTVTDLVGSSGLTGIAARAVEGRDPSAAALRFVQSNTPFINLFWVKPVLDYLFFWHAQEAVNPGSLKRMEREMQQRSGQEFYIKPSEAVR